MTTKDDSLSLSLPIHIYIHIRQRRDCYLVWWLPPFICILIWRLRFPDWEKRRRHSEHSYGFSREKMKVLDCFLSFWGPSPFSLPPLCTRICFVNVELSENAFRQYLHWYGRSPECVLIWVVTDELWENFRPHTSHENGFSPECVRRWAVRFAAWVNAFEHLSHLYGYQNREKWRLALR